MALVGLKLPASRKCIAGGVHTKSVEAYPKNKIDNHIEPDSYRLFDFGVPNRDLVSQPCCQTMSDRYIQKAGLSQPAFRFIYSIIAIHDAD
jgi:hypothetical protein